MNNQLLNQDKCTVYVHIEFIYIHYSSKSTSSCLNYSVYRIAGKFHEENFTISCKIEHFTVLISRFLYPYIAYLMRRKFCEIGQIAKITNIKPREIFQLYGINISRQKCLNLCGSKCLLKVPWKFISVSTIYFTNY